MICSENAVSPLRLIRAPEPSPALRLPSNFSQFFAVFRHFSSAFRCRPRYKRGAKRRPAMKGDDTGHPAAQRDAEERADRDQPILAPLPDARQLGREAARRVRAARIDRRDEACRPARRPHPVPRRPAQFPDARPACASARRSRRSCAPTSSWSARRSPSSRARSSIARSVRDFVSRDLFESILESEEEPYRLPRNPVRDDRADGPAELHPAAVQAGGGIAGKGPVPGLRNPHSSEMMAPIALPGGQCSSLMEFAAFDAVHPVLRAPPIGVMVARGE